MIIEYHRPGTLTEALTLLNRDTPYTIPLGGGGTFHNRNEGDLAVVDLQDLGLNQLERTGQQFLIGATSRLQALVDWGEFPQPVKDFLKYEFTLNIRNSATLAGSIVSTTRTSCFTAALMALDCRVVWEPGKIEIPLGDWLALRGKWSLGKIITSIKFILPQQIKFEKISRSPGDLPIMSVCLSQWSSGRNRLVLGGVGNTPMCVFDGTEETGMVEAAINACSQSSIKHKNNLYYQEMIKLLINRISRLE